jgi:hypothetical protein
VRPRPPGVLQPYKSSTSKHLGFLFIERMTYFTINVFFKAGVSRLVLLTAGLLCEDPGPTEILTFFELILLLVSPAYGVLVITTTFCIKT